MITLYGEGRGFRVSWLLEEMGLPYRLRRVDLLAGVENDPEFLAINPGGFIPALRDGDTTLVESIAIMEYLLARHGPSPLALRHDEPEFGAYQQFLHLGEAGLAGPMYIYVVSRMRAPGGECDNLGAQIGMEVFESRLGLVTRRLAEAPYMAGERFTAADISITYALQFAERSGEYRHGQIVRDYIDRTTARDGYRQAMATCVDTREWVARLEAERTA